MLDNIFYGSSLFLISILVVDRGTSAVVQMKNRSSFWSWSRNS
jgi:hypothetical protein